MAFPWLSRVTKVLLELVAGDIASPTNGSIWYNDTTGKFRAQEGGTTKDLISAGGGSSVDSRMPNWMTDFSHTNAVQNYFIMAAVSSGTFTTAPVAGALSPNHPGVLQWRSSTTANSGVHCSSSGVANRIGGGEVWDVNFFTAPVLTTITFRSGAYDVSTSAAAVDAVHFRFSTSGAIVGACRSNSVETVTATLATLAASTWYHGRITVNAGGTSVNFSIYSDAGVLLGSADVTTNSPTAAGRELGWGTIITSSGTTAIVLGHMDRQRLTNPGRTVARGAA